MDKLPEAAAARARSSSPAVSRVVGRSVGVSDVHAAHAASKRTGSVLAARRNALVDWLPFMGMVNSTL